MKKILSIILLISFLCCLPALAVNMPGAPVDMPQYPTYSNQSTNNMSTYQYTAEDKKSFYDGFLESMFPGFYNSLISQGFTKESSAHVTSILKTRINRKQLEAETWGCVTKYSPDYLMHEQNAQRVYDECFGAWQKKTIEDNMDLSQLLKR